MFKLFINNVQIGNFKNLKTMFNSAIYNQHAVSSIKWIGKSCYVKTF